MAHVEKKPNVLLVISDQHRFDALGAYGNADIKTPHIDALAADGVTYQNCFATFPVCTPSRYSLLSGLYVHQHLGWTNRSTLPHGLDTFPRLLKELGYHTKAVGKMHFTPTYADVGFDEMVLAEQDGPGRYDDDYHRYLRDRGLVDYSDLRDQVGEYRKHAGDQYFANFGSDPSNLPDEHYSTTWIGDRACEALESWEGGGHLLEVGFIKPHHPFDAPPPWSEMYDPETLSLPPGWTDACDPVDQKMNSGYFDFTTLTPDSFRQVLAQYYASISQIDHHVGRMIQILKDKGLYDDTLVIYTSDHGDYMGHHHLVLKSNYMYDPVIKVPLVVKYPATGRPHEAKAGGVTRTDLVSNIDITATILDVTGANFPMQLWRVIRPLADGHREVVFAETNAGDYMVRTPTRKLLLCETKKTRYYNLETDPHELHDAADDPQYEAEIAALRERLFAWLAFEARSQIHQDHHSFTCDAPNVPAFDDGHRDAIRDYFARAVEALRASGEIEGEHGD